MLLTQFDESRRAVINPDHSNRDPRSLSGTARLDDKQKIALLAFELATIIA